ncbi:KamA family radical SAM protein [Candidatus Bipolaricaulota bacterium]|nr:KamA family radical SAM protein [Candidatus Bipolaricaulota bacterium]
MDTSYLRTPHRTTDETEARLWAEDGRVYEILTRCETFEEGREPLAAYLEEREWEYRAGDLDLSDIEISKALEAIGVFKDLISPRNEELAGFSTLRLLWRLAKSGAAQAHVGTGFIDEFAHLSRAINGRSGIGEGWIGPRLRELGLQANEYIELEGRAAGRARSRYLDGMASAVQEQIGRFESGLEPAAVARQMANREKILAYFGGSGRDWRNSKWQLAHILRGEAGVKALRALVPLSPEENESVELAVKHGIPWAITLYYLSLFNFESADRLNDSQVRSQVIPPIDTVRQMIEHRRDREECFDFMGEHDTSPIDLVTRRYATIAIVKPVDTCPQICVYCQRNWEIRNPVLSDMIPSKPEIDAALDWVASHPFLMEVLVTGGDPFILSDEQLEYLLKRLAAMSHLTSIRLGTRILVTLPMRITDRFAALIGRYIKPGRRNVSVVTHVESSAEVTPELAAAVHRLRKHRISVYNQQVFTVHTSHRFQSVATRVALMQVGIDPYYTFYPKGKKEHSAYLVPIARILQERKEEARLLPGLFRTDEPVFNVPRLGKHHLRGSQDRELIGIKRSGRRVYLFHPWEKGIAPVKPWPYVDTAITHYLARMEQLGEDPKAYESIWYYY